jgi:transposase-like protein
MSSEIRSGVRAPGAPWDHLQEVRGARNAVEGAREALGDEARRQAGQEARRQWLNEAELRRLSGAADELQDLGRAVDELLQSVQP